MPPKCLLLIGLCSAAASSYAAPAHHPQLIQSFVPSTLHRERASARRDGGTTVTRGHDDREKTPAGRPRNDRSRFICDRPNGLLIVVGRSVALMVGEWKKPPILRSAGECLHLLTRLRLIPCCPMHDSFDRRPDMHCFDFGSI